MSRLSLKQRLRAVSSALSSLLLASGCHYYGNSNPAAPYSDYDSMSSPPFYRSFPQPSFQPYDSAPQAPLPPSVLPVPGYSEPDEMPVPPAPSVQRSKWNLFPSNLKFPGFGRQNSQVQQTTSKGPNTDFSQKTPKSKEKEIATLPELSSTATPVTNDGTEYRQGVRSVSRQDDGEQEPAPRLKLSRKSRASIMGQLPAPVAGDDSSVEGQTSVGEAPKLLPPPQ